MKTFVVSLLLLMGLITNAQSIGLRLGHSLTPADQVSLHYAHWTNSAINPAGTLFYERSRSKGLDYSCYGLDLLAEYASNQHDESLPLLGWRGGLGATIQHEDDPWLYKNISSHQKINYGIVAEGSLVCYLTTVFRLHLFAQQKILLRGSPMSTGFAFGLGLSYQLDNN